jgi:hypothetical protein
MAGVQVKQSRKEIEWRQRLARFAAGGQQINAFCQDEAVSEASFHRWRKLLRVTAGLPAPAVFLDAGMMAVPSPAAQQMMHDAPGSSTALDVRLELGGGLVLHIVRR